MAQVWRDARTQGLNPNWHTAAQPGPSRMTSIAPPPPSPSSPSAIGRSFNELPLSPALHANLQQLEYLTMTPIQAASLPISLAGHDLIAQAKTGSGKTAAFALTLLTNLNPRRFAVQAMVLCPTRELADQVTQEIRRLARFEDNIKVLALCGGTTMRPQMASLEHGAHVVVGTPGRIMDHIERGSLRLDALNTLVLDEADRMLDMGFHDDIAFVAKRCPAAAPDVALLGHLSAKASRALAQQFLRKPQEVKLLEQHEAGKIRQRFYEVTHEARLQAVGALLKHYRPVSTLAFCNTKQQCRDLLEVLQAQGFHALTLNGDMEQRERDQVLIQFANRSCSVLVATDVAARGLDIAQLEAVINVDVTPDPEIHIHRIGRTGRGDEEGWALSLCSHNDKRRVASHRPDDGQRTGVAWLRLAANRRRRAPGAADGDAADTRRAQGEDPPRRRAGRPHRRSGPDARASRQDHGDRSIDLCGRRTRVRARSGAQTVGRQGQGQDR